MCSKSKRCLVYITTCGCSVVSGEEVSRVKRYKCLMYVYALCSACTMISYLYHKTLPLVSRFYRRISVNFELYRICRENICRYEVKQKRLMTVFIFNDYDSYFFKPVLSSKVCNYLETSYILSSYKSMYILQYVHSSEIRLYISYFILFQPQSLRTYIHPYWYLLQFTLIPTIFTSIPIICTTYRLYYL